MATALRYATGGASIGGNVSLQFPKNTPPPYEIPAERLGKNPSYDIKRPVMVTVVACYLFAKAVAYVLCALTLWGPPDSGAVAFLYAHGRFVFHELPPPFMPFRGAADYSEDAYHSLLPVAFAVVGIYSFLAGGFLMALNYWVRWITMFVSGATAIKTLIYFSANFVGGDTIPITGEIMAALIINVVPNIIICLYLAFYPEVAEAFAKDEP